jgi:hypothetical protein
MGHYIQVIVAPIETAKVISKSWPEIPRLDYQNGYAIFCVDADLIDARIAPDKTPTVTGDEFILLTDGFRELLKSMSHKGELAYVETDYFGGVGGQGAVGYRSGEEVMPPKWKESDTINEALELIGVPLGQFSDRFSAMGFDQIRSNGDILGLIE